MRSHREMLYKKVYLTLSWRKPLSNRNQSIDLLCKSMDWFLYDNGLRHERVNYFTNLSGKICVGVSFFQKKSRRLKVSNFIKRKRLRHSCFSLSFVKVFKNNYFVEHPCFCFTWKFCAKYYWNVFPALKKAKFRKFSKTCNQTSVFGVI